MTLLASPALSQTNEEKFNGPSCGFLTKGEIDPPNHYGNNDILIQKLREHNFDVPVDYFQNIDGLGMYNGAKLTPASIKQKSDKIDLIDEVYDEQTVVSAMAARAGSTTYYVPLKIFVYSDGSGNRAMTDNEINVQLRVAQRLFDANGVPFVFYVKCNVVERNSGSFTDFYDLSDEVDPVAEFSDMIAASNDNNAINIHVVGTGTASNILGESEVNGTHLYIAGEPSAQQNSTLTHELGHIFNLLHPFHGEGCTNETNGYCNECDQEGQSRTRTYDSSCGADQGKKTCDISGDYLCDTPGDPGMTLFNYTTGCAFSFWPVGPTYNDEDFWGDTWTPAFDNIMSNVWDQCATDFTLGQVAVMLDRIDDFSFVYTSATNSITGPTLVCSGSTYNYSTTNQGSGVDYQWVVPEGWAVTSGQGTRNVSITPSGSANTTGTIHVIPICGNRVQTLDVSIDNNSLKITGPSSIADVAYPRNYSYYTEYYAGNSYNWTVPSGWSITTGSGTFSIGVQAPANPNPGSVTVSTTVCGSTASGSKYVSVSGGGDPPLLVAGPGVFSPNPANEEISLVGLDVEQTITDIQILNLNTGAIVFTKSVLGGKQSINISGIKSGYYQVSYIINGELRTEKIIKE